MSGKPRLETYKTIRGLVNRLRDDLRDSANGGKDYVLLYAYNGTGKTRLSMAFKDAGKKRNIERDTLYFNAFTEDLFHWDNDLENDQERVLKLNSDSRFFTGFKALALEEKIAAYLHRYTDIAFRIDYENWAVTFSREVQAQRRDGIQHTTVDRIKVSRGEENIFVWCIFLVLCELAIDGAESYDWVKYLYIDDPISSLDDNNAIAVASDLARVLKQGDGRIKTVISTHHGLFFNVMSNELKEKSHRQYFLHRASGQESYTLQATDDAPFFHHVAMLSELKKAADSGRLYTYHFNILRGILEKTATFFGFDEFSVCIRGIEDEVLFARALNLLSHGKYSIYEPREMVEDTKRLFRNILDAFLERYQFSLPELFPATSTPQGQS